MALVILFCKMVRGKRSSWHSISLPVAKGCSPTVVVSVAVVEDARLNSENVAIEKKSNSFKLSGDRLHACGDVTSCCCCSSAGRASATAGRASAKELATGQESGQAT